MALRQIAHNSLCLQIVLCGRLTYHGTWVETQKRVQAVFDSTASGLSTLVGDVHELITWLLHAHPQSAIKA